ncbi:hypothetical protein FIBSPDRAFT_924215 [Athelia psychrophila]|uniref:Uncharacterized protein n=1 Tax=Athelia psychrophila TaxID=1759441 RepID=A0A166WHJ1_9AGAM|nr:hypothetical protein FIBSPDRAFT_924215 [Fibularhizoctonia sp. CBS 109695]
MGLGKAEQEGKDEQIKSSLYEQEERGPVRDSKINSAEADILASGKKYVQAHVYKFIQFPVTHTTSPARYSRSREKVPGGDQFGHGPGTGQQVIGQLRGEGPISERPSWASIQTASSVKLTCGKSTPEHEEESNREDVAERVAVVKQKSPTEQNVNMAVAKQGNRDFAGFGVLLAPKFDPQQIASCRQIDVRRGRLTF